MQFIGDKNFDCEATGAKAANLHELKRCGFNVPSGFVISTRSEALSISNRDIAEIGGFPVAVRSNSLIEDQSNASYAGQFSSFLNIDNFIDLQRAITRCFDSIDEAPSYTGQHLSSSSMHVFVQRMVPATFAGVCFSICPVSGDESLQIEFVEGLAEDLVSGKKTPHSLQIDYSGTIISNPPPILNNKDFWQNFAKIVCSIQAHFAKPQDIEWAFDGNELFILQSRPITKVAAPKTEHIFTTADFREGGLGTAACTPMLFSLYEQVFDPSLKAYFVAIGLGDRVFLKTPLLKQYAARGYWNVSAVKRLLKKLPGFDERSFDEDLGIYCQYSYNTKTPISLSGIIKSIPVLIRLYLNFYRVLKAETVWTAEFKKNEAKLKANVEKLNSSHASAEGIWRCYEEWRSWHKVTEQRYFTTIYNSTNAKIEFEKYLNSLRRIIPDISVNKLTQNLGNVGHVALKNSFDQLLAKYREGKLDEESCTGFLNTYYYAADAELDLRQKRWAEDPASFSTMIERFAALSEQRLSAPNQCAFQDEQLRISKLLNLSRRLFFKWHLRRTRSFLVMREKLRIHSSKAYAVGRLVLLKVGELMCSQGMLRQPHDIFYCNVDEIDLQGIDLATIDSRKTYVEGFKNFDAPEEFGGGIMPTELAESVAILRGVGCSSGRVEGRIRIIRSPAEFERLLPGDLLVTRFTDPGWTPLLGRASGVITEVGGLLCHAAIICRELGIPAVVNVKQLLEVVNDGQLVRIDGDTGSIEFLS